MQGIQDSINDDQIKKKFTELRQELGDKLRRYTVDELCEIYYELYKNGYIINGFLGSGTEGPVFSVINNGNQVAVKVISGSDASQIDNELKIMKKFQNQPYIHQYLSSFYSKNNKYFFYLTEKLTCDLEQIMSAMEDKQQKFSYNEIIAFAIQMVTALSTLEASRVLHSDLKPANILYDKNNKCFKISDYGFSRIIQQKFSQQTRSATQSIKGCTPKYAAPEIIQQSQDYTCKVDIYSLGLILLELVYGRELNLLQTMQILGGANNIPQYLNKDKQYDSLNELIQSMLVIDRYNRISAQHLLKKLKSLQSEQESRLYSDISGYLKTRVDEITLQNMEQNLKQLKQIYSSSLTQINIDYIKVYTIIKFDSPLLKKVNNNYGNNIIITNQQQFQEVQQQPQLSYQLNNYFSGTNIGYQQQNDFMPQQQQQWQQQQQKYQQPQYNQQQFQQFSSNQPKNYNQVYYQQQSNSNAQGGYQQQNYQSYQQPSYAQPIQQQLGVQNKYPQQQQQQFNQQQIIQPILKKQYKQLKFKDKIKTVKQLTEVEEALANYQNDINTSLHVGLKLFGYYSNETELTTKLGASVVASRLASGLEKCSLSITSLSLDFSWLKIGPEGMKSISQSIGMMHQNLTTLSLSFYCIEIGPKGASSLATAIEKCKKNLLVVGLKFCDNDIGSDEIKYLSQSLEKCDKMTTLGLYLYNYSLNKVNIVNIGPTGACYLTQSLPKCKSLTELTLSLSYCKITNKGLQSLSSGLSKCEKLTRLNVNIQGDSINEQPIEEFGSSLARCPNLITLSVEFMQLPQGHWQSLIYAITPSLPLFAKQQLTTLTLFLNKDVAENISTLETNLKEYYNITSLCLEMQFWSLGNTSSLVESLEKSNLTTLKLIFHHFEFGYFQSQTNRLGKSLLRLQKLTSLYLFCRGFQGHPRKFISTLLCNHLAKNKNITTLSLGVVGSSFGAYQLTSSDSKMIGESLEKCKSLQTLHLYLWDNTIYSEGALTISQSLSKCAHLTALDLSVVEDHCCNKDYHKHVYTNYMDLASPSITNDLKKCKNLGELKVKVRSEKSNENFERKMYIKLGILTKFESNFWPDY